MGRAGVVCGRRGRVSLPGGPAAQVLEGQRSGPGVPGSEACPFAFGGLRLCLWPCVPSGTLRVLSAHLHGVRLRGLALCVRPAIPEAPESGVASATDSGLRLASSHALESAGSWRATRLSVLLHTFTVGWRRSLLFYILKT